MAVKYPFPRFYIKAVGGDFSLHHRLTHLYLGSVKTEKELVAEIKVWNRMTEEEIWTEVLETPSVRIPSTMNMNDKSYTYDEEWFAGAWSSYTDKFYDKYPKLLVQTENIPFDYINSFRRQKAEAQHAKHREEEKVKREREKEYNDSLKVVKEKPKDITGKIGSIQGLEKMKNQKKKLKRKVSVDTGKHKVDLMISDDPFA